MKNRILLLIICLSVVGCAATITTFDKDENITGGVKIEGLGAIEGETPEGYKIKKGIFNIPDFNLRR